MNSAKWKRATTGLFPVPEQKNDEDLKKKTTTPYNQTQDSIEM